MVTSSKSSRQKSLQKVRGKATFLDRDGTIIRYVEVLTKPSQLRLLPGAAQAIKRFNQLGFLVIVHTNQPIIEKGYITRKEVDELHRILAEKISRQGGKINAFYVCPHRYPSKCSCRKPRLGMIKRAARKFEIDLRKSFIVGDGLRDIETGKRAGMKTILVKTRKDNKDDAFFKGTEPDYIVNSLGAAARLVKKNSQ